MDRLIRIITGEFVLLDHMPNGGKAVFLRPIYVSVLIYLSALGLKSYSDPFTVFAFSAKQLMCEVSNTVPWLGAILGLVYTAFYTRFASQWSYLADLYNQQMQAYFSISDSNEDLETYARWQAGFVEDCVNMHMVTKSSFHSFIMNLLEDERVTAALISSACFGEAKLSLLKKNLA